MGCRFAARMSGLDISTGLDPVILSEGNPRREAPGRGRMGILGAKRSTLCGMFAGANTKPRCRRSDNGAEGRKRDWVVSLVGYRSESPTFFSPKRPANQGGNPTRILIWRAKMGALDYLEWSGAYSRVPRTSRARGHKLLLAMALHLARCSPINCHRADGSTRQAVDGPPGGVDRLWKIGGFLASGSTAGTRIVLIQSSAAQGSGLVRYRSDRPSRQALTAAG